jgi:hypothetical protein
MRVRRLSARPLQLSLNSVTLTPSATVPVRFMVRQKQSTLILKREGFGHFERLHGVVLDHHYECTLCHSDMGTPLTARHRINSLAQIESCRLCHLAQ